MSQHDFDIANATASNARVDINLALKALGSLSSGVTEPTTRYANMLWYNTSTNLLRMRNEANDDWINIGYVDQAGGVFSILNNTKTVATDGSDRGLLGPQLESAWTAGTSTTESLVSPAKVKAAISSSVVFSAAYISAEQTITAGGLLTLTHGLGAMPSLIQARLVCKSSDLGYSVNDEVIVNNHTNAVSNASYGQSLEASSTTISVGFGQGNVYQLLNKSTGAAALITPASWSLVVRAWA